MHSNDHKIVTRAEKRPAGEHSTHFDASMLNEVAIMVAGENLVSHNIVVQRGQLHIEMSQIFYQFFVDMFVDMETKRLHIYV